MQFRFIEEPSLAFGLDQHLCPKAGISQYGPYDINHARHDKIIVGLIGKPNALENVLTWLELCKSEVSGKKSKKTGAENSNLFPAFPGFNRNVGFRCALQTDESYTRKLNASDFDDVVAGHSDMHDLIEAVAALYLEEIKYLAKNKRPDVILCVLEEKLIDKIKEVKKAPATDEEMIIERDDEEDGDGGKHLEKDFRRHLKARAMEHGIPIQIVRDRVTKPSGEMQDPASIAWNFFTALYYKAQGTPWALIRRDMSEATCYAGISFYKSRDRKTTQTSIAQIFNELGNGVILRGEEIVRPKYDNTPHLGGEQAYTLLYDSLKEYHEAVRQTPKRLVLHKTSNFNQAEIEGFKQAAKAYHIHQVDLITILDSDFRLYRAQAYPPLRGTQLSFSEKHHLLYTRGSVPYYGTYPGMYVPRAIEVRLFSHDESPNQICDEIIALTKMNWNNTHFDRRIPITLECARNVGSILKYLGSDDPMQLRYSFYM